MMETLHGLVRDFRDNIYTSGWVFENNASVKCEYISQQLKFNEKKQQYMAFSYEIYFERNVIFLQIIV